MIDLRSDTVTRPTPAMRDAMARAEVGDDVYGEDPTVRALEERVAAMLGKQAALFVSSGTMGNQLALMLSTRRGDEVICGEGAHCAFFESGAGAALAGVQFAYAGRGGLFDDVDLDAAAKPSAYYYPRTSLVAVENTHNRAGGRVFRREATSRVAVRAKALGLGLHLDGARLWHAAIVEGCSVAELAEPFDTVSVCFSKGLGAPVGSALASTRARIDEARRLRKMLGGGMRQVGVLAAAALYALDHHVERLGDDHARARGFAADVRARLAARGGAGALVLEPETNVVCVDVAVPAERVVERAKLDGLLVSAIADRRVRAVFHLDVDDAATSAGARSLADAIVELAP